MKWYQTHTWPSSIAKCECAEEQLKERKKERNNNWGGGGKGFRILNAESFMHVSLVEAKTP